ncbi:PRELI-like family-domain-containing protein [Dipodascopsis tothii]|uniref:PRELI-like family-domain-containing protein n=1 Tax=Dipodascopsis tothii TaxID=44089 RepID=UPI0034CD9239
MKVFTSDCHFDHPWDRLTAANWKKYPNELSTHVVAVDVLRREINPATQVLMTERLITCRQNIPTWITALIGAKNVSYVREVSEVDLKNHTLTMRSVNLTMNNLLRVQETVQYKPESATRTLFHQEATIEAFASFQKVCNKIEDWSLERFRQNAALGRAGFESVLQKLNLERAAQLAV